MKKLFHFSAIMAIALIWGCSNTNTKSTDLLLENSKEREVIFHAIMNNPSYLKDFTEMISKDDKSGNTITGNLAFVKAIFMSNKMDTLIKRDPLVMESMNNRWMKRILADSAVCDVTCSRLMENERFQRNFRNRFSNVKSNKNR